MVGIAGTTAGDRVLSGVVDGMNREPWYEVERLDGEGVDLALVHHGGKDPGGHATWDGEDGAGVRYGAFSNAADLDESTGDLLSGVLERPSEVLPAIDGPFVVACTSRSGDRAVVATDRLGTRSCYFTDSSPLVFGSDLGAILDATDDVAVDHVAAADMLSYGFVLGDRTLAEGVSSVRPASFLRYEDGEWSVVRYWKPSFGRLPEEGYVERVCETYRESMSNVADTLSGRVGVWLSGGLDSRTMAAVLGEEYGPVRGLTYDGNPPDGTNIAPAREIADLLGIEHRLVAFDPGDFERLVETGVRVTGGTVRWSTFVSPKFVLEDLHDEVDVVMEAAPQGELLGEDFTTHALQHSSPEAAVRGHMGIHPPDRVASLLNSSVDPERSLREAVAASDERHSAHRAIDTWLHEMPANGHFRSDDVYRSQVGMRLPFAAESFLETVAKMPSERFRRGAVPLTGGRVPRSMSPLKRDVILSLDDGIEDVPYERTRLAPRRPMVAHDAAYVTKQLRWRYVSGRPGRSRDRLRTHTPERRAVRGWLDGAGDRRLLNEDAIERLWSEHVSGDADHYSELAALTTLELWMQASLD